MGTRAPGLSTRTFLVASKKTYVRISLNKITITLEDCRAFLKQSSAAREEGALFSKRELQRDSSHSSFSFSSFLASKILLINKRREYESSYRATANLLTPRL